MTGLFAKNSARKWKIHRRGGLDWPPDPSYRREAANQRERSALIWRQGQGICPDLPYQRFGGKLEFEQRLPGLVRHFQEPFWLRAHDVAGEIGAHRSRLFPGSFGTFKGRTTLD